MRPLMVTWLAAEDLKSPIALMTILTPERQWFKSRHGLAMPDTPRSWAFCNHTVLQWDVLEFRNLAKHESFADNPAVAGDISPSVPERRCTTVTGSRWGGSVSSTTDPASWTPSRPTQ